MSYRELFNDNFIYYSILFFSFDLFKYKIGLNMCVMWYIMFLLSDSGSVYGNYECDKGYL